MDLSMIKKIISIPFCLTKSPITLHSAPQAIDLRVRSRYVGRMDLLADVLAVSGVRGNVGARVEAGEDRGVRRTGMPGAAFHAVTAGVVWLRLPGEPQGKLMPGDVVLLSTSTEHTPASDPGAVARTRDGEAAEITREDGYLYGSASVRTRIPCTLRARPRGLDPGSGFAPRDRPLRARRTYGSNG